VLEIIDGGGYRLRWQRDSGSFVSFVVMAPKLTNDLEPPSVVTLQAAQMAMLEQIVGHAGLALPRTSSASVVSARSARLGPCSAASRCLRPNGWLENLAS
jgi:hypothetical protein